MSKMPLLSIGMIVKDEIRCLEKCLKALQPLRDAIPCELVIADTGSTDGTREIAEKYADILFDFKWVSDFAAARNAVLEKCSGEWYLSVDADEYMKPDISELVNFLRGKKNKDYNRAVVVVRNHTAATMDGYYADAPLPRLARRIPDLRFEGVIHEHFPAAPGDVTITLPTVIFDHDGYVEFSEEYWEKKAARNLELLESELAEKPHDLQLLQQCLESAATFTDRHVVYAYRSMEVLRTYAPDDINRRFHGPVIVRESVFAAIAGKFPETEEWIRWGRENFPESPVVQIDLNCIYLSFLCRAERYFEAREIGRAYFAGLKRYHENGFDAGVGIASSLQNLHVSRQATASMLTALAASEIGDTELMLQMMLKTPLAELGKSMQSTWFVLLEKSADQEDAAKFVAEQLAPVLENKASRTEKETDLFNLAMTRITLAFTPGYDDNAWRLYRKMPGTIGVCAKLAMAQDRAEAEALLGQVDDFTKLLPLAFKRSVTLGAMLPNGFYSLSVKRLRSFHKVILNDSLRSVDHLLTYTAAEHIADRMRVNFAFELLTTFWVENEMAADAIDPVLADRFAEVGEKYLALCYGSAELADEESVSCLPALSRFTWYYIKAMQYCSAGDMSACTTQLSVALKHASEMSKLVKFVIHHIEAKGRAARIKETPPELLSLAEQVKTILAMYPADDPAVIQLKQTPAYQQVAFLIER